MSRARPPLTELIPRKVCLIKPSSLGDVVHALPVLSALRSHWLDAQFSWVIHRGLRGLVEGHPALERVILFDRGRLRPRPGALPAIGALFGELRRPGFDLTIDLQGLLRSGLMAAATRAKVRAGFAESREGSGRFYTHRIAANPDRPHAVDRLLEVARAFGARVESPRFEVPVGSEDQAWAAERLAAVPRPVLAVNLGARWLTKRWAPASFAAVARRAASSHGAGIVVLGAPEDRPLVQEFQKALGLPCLDLCGATSLKQLAAVSGRADLFLSNDTGPLHLAAAMGTRVVGVYTCTRPEWTGPYGDRAVVVTTRVPCAGSCVKTCNHFSCLNELSVERVSTAVESQFQRMSARHGAA